MDINQAEISNPETVCQLCNQSGTGMDVRHLHIMEVVRSGISKVELLVEYENLKAWKLKEVKTLQTYVCTDCVQKVLQRDQEKEKKRRPFLIAASVLVGLFLMWHISKVFIFPFLLMDILWWLIMGIGGLAFFVFLTITKNLKPETAAELYLNLEHQNLRKPLIAAFEKETGRPVRIGIYHLLDSISGPGKSLYLLNDKENTQILENERVFHGWSVVRRVINSPMPQSAPVSPSVVLKNLGRPDDPQKK